MGGQEGVCVVVGRAQHVPHPPDDLWAPVARVAHRDPGVRREVHRDHPHGGAVLAGDVRHDPALAAPHPLPGQKVPLVVVRRAAVEDAHHVVVARYVHPPFRVPQAVLGQYPFVRPVPRKKLKCEISVQLKLLPLVLLLLCPHEEAVLPVQAVCDVPCHDRELGPDCLELCAQELLQPLPLLVGALPNVDV